MAELHDALRYLGPVDWSDVPKDQEALEQYLTDCFAAGELICNSVPPLADGTPFNASKPHHDTPNSASSHRDIHPSAARSPPPHPDHEALQKHWGKPMKFNQKQNPLKISLYKMAGHDRHGAWFARRCVTEGLGFAKFKAAMMRELAETMTVSGGPGAGAIRGLGADRRLERVEVPGIGKLEVFQLSAQFPGPVTPRDFVTLLLSGDQVLSEKSAAAVDGTKGHVPRHFMAVSKPVEHPDAPIRAGFVRGHYESVELIRGNASSSSGDPELNPVEWVMITRSDPGGGIPRFLVERGTPETMLEDVHKFFNWACAQDHIPHPDEDLDKQGEVSVGQAEADGAPLAPFEETNGNAMEQTKSRMATAGSANERFDAYAPAAVSNMVHAQLRVSEQLSDDSSDTSSVDSFLSAEEIGRVTTAPETRSEDSVETLSIASGDHSETSGRPLSRHEKEVKKLTEKREKLEQQLAKKRMAEEQKTRQAHVKEQSEADKSKEKLEKDLKKTEERHRKEMEKLEAKKAKEMRKAEEKRRKKDEQSKLSLVSRERDEFRSQGDLLRRENGILREQVAELQAQNTRMSMELGKLGGQETLRSISDEYGHRRTGSLKSTTSGRS
ncbi:uncharacterized protein MYCFIDRAFT_96822, partial [Pseudocercospora fijiensis CIRAD86]